MSAKKKPRRWTASGKLRVVLACLDGSVEISELCRREGINPTQYYGWKKQLLTSATKMYADDRESMPSAKEQLPVGPRLSSCDLAYYSSPFFSDLFYQTAKRLW